MKRLLLVLPMLLTAWVALPVTDARADQRYDRPRVDGVRLDWCREWARNCGQPAADAFCRRQGHRRATDFAKANNISRRTRVITSGRVCGPGCDSFRYVTCGTRPDRDPPRGARRFDRPRINGLRLDWCRIWGQECGQPAADAFCRARGFRRAGRFEMARDIGRRGPTRIIGSGQVCRGDFCDGFRFVDCVGRGGGAGGRDAVFRRPMFRGARLDWCREWARNCGKPAADAFCRMKGFRGSRRHEIAEDIGDRSPTRVITSGQICGDRYCDGFRVIVCGR